MNRGTARATAGWRARPERHGTERHERPSGLPPDRQLDRPLDRRLGRLPDDRRVRARRAEILPRIVPGMGAWARLWSKTWTWRAGRGPLH